MQGIHRAWLALFESSFVDLHKVLKRTHQAHCAGCELDELMGLI